MRNGCSNVTENEQTRFRLVVQSNACLSYYVIIRSLVDVISKEPITMLKEIAAEIGMINPMICFQKSSSKCALWR